jgi:hypothetical protein
MTRIARIAIQDADCVARAPGAVTASSGAAQPRAMRRDRPLSRPALDALQSESAYIRVIRG